MSDTTIFVPRSKCSFKDIKAHIITMGREVVLDTSNVTQEVLDEILTDKTIRTHHGGQERLACKWEQNTPLKHSSDRISCIIQLLAQAKPSGIPESYFISQSDFSIVKQLASIDGIYCIRHRSTGEPIYFIR